MESKPPDMPGGLSAGVITLPGLFMLAFKNWKRLAVICIATTVFSYGIVFTFIKPAYKASSLIIPLDQQNPSAAASMLKGISNLPISLGGLNSASQQLDLFETILTSRTTLMDLSDKFDLKRRFKIKKNEDLLKVLRKKVAVGSTRQNSFVITCIAGSPDTSALMTNYLVDYLNSKVISLNVSKAHENKEFLGTRLADVRSDLEASEDSMTFFQQTNNILELRTQMRSSLDNYAKIESELYLKEIERGIMQRYLTAEAPQMAMLNSEMDVIRRKLSQLKTGKDRGSNLIYPVSEMAQKSKEYLRLERNITIYTTLLQVILPLHEQAKYEEQKSIPVIQIIDKAVPPERKFFPPRTMIAGCCGLIGAMCFLILLFLKEVLPVVSTPAWLELFRYIRLIKQ